MRGGYPVKAHQILHCQFDRNTPISKQTFDESKVTESYWVISGPWKSKVLGDCGHKHATREEAEEQCLKPMTELYRKLRWGKKEQYGKLKEAMDRYQATTKGTPEYEQAWQEFLDVLLSDQQ